MGLRFGTSGIRGLVTDLTDREGYLYTLAFLQHTTSKTPVERVCVAGDLRSSTPRILKSVVFAATSKSLMVDNCGFIPTPALVLHSIHNRAPGIMVTGSHIPDDRNGMKFNLPWGEILKDDELAITRIYDKLQEWDRGQQARDTYPFNQIGMLKPDVIVKTGEVNQLALENYIARYINYFTAGTLAGLKIVNYQHSAAARDTTSHILKHLGADVIEVGRSDTFIPVDTESVENADQLKQWVLEYNADALISTDGDSDRPLLLDESGDIVRGDTLGILVAKYLTADSVSVPVSCNTALELSGYFTQIQRTRIGSPYVVEAMNTAKESGSKKVVGYEANGGFLTANDFVNESSGKILKALPTRDALLPILSVLTLAKRTRTPISGLMAELPSRFTTSGLLRRFPNNKGRRIVEQFKLGHPNFAAEFLSPHFGAVKSIDFTDGVRTVFANGDIVHLRPSGNAPEMRCYTEAKTPQRALEINEKALRLVRQTDLSEYPTNWDISPVKPYLTEDVCLANIELMNHAAPNGVGMDVIIVSTTSSYQETFWQRRLEGTRGQITNANALILTVHEDWPGGAGNGLGTLYALSKANERARKQYNIDILEKLRDGASIGLYHTAGKGTRLAPLPASEVNNKPGVKLPGLVTMDGDVRPITLLESVIKQTSIYAASRRGRISVFWGDQVFIPSVQAKYEPRHHIDILCQLGKMPDGDEWERKGLEKYGLIAVGADGNASQVEKIGYDTAVRLIQSRAISVEQGIGVSIGSFSVSSEMTVMLLKEFSDELTLKHGKYDTDPHFWMPLTLDEDVYLGAMSQKGIKVETARSHYARMSRFKERFRQRYTDARLFGAVDIGEDSFWWDYGNITAYMENTRKVVASGNEAEAMRQFFIISHPIYRSKLNRGVAVEKSYIVNSRINRGRIKNSVILGVTADYIDVEDCVLIAVSAPKIVANKSLLYNFIDTQELVYNSKTVRADCLISDSTWYTMLTSLDRDGSGDWKVRLPGNKISYEELYTLNQDVDIISVEALNSTKHRLFAQETFDAADR